MTTRKSRSSNSLNFLEWLDSLSTEEYKKTIWGIRNLLNDDSKNRYGVRRNDGIPMYFDHNFSRTAMVKYPIGVRVVISDLPHNHPENGANYQDPVSINRTTSPNKFSAIHKGRRI